MRVRKGLQGVMMIEELRKGCAEFFQEGENQRKAGLCLRKMGARLAHRPWTVAPPPQK